MLRAGRNTHRQGGRQGAVEPVAQSGVLGSATVRTGGPRESWEFQMLWTIVVVLLVLWALGFAVHIGGGLIHVLLVIALIVVVVRLLQGRRVV